jgi:hypothetical protein
MAFDKDAFFAELLKDIKVDDSQLEAFEQVKLAIAGNPNLAKRLEDSTLRQSDYSRKQKELQDQITKTSAYYKELQDWKEKAQKELTEQLSGSSTSPKGIVPDGQHLDMSRFVTPEMLEEKLNLIQGSALDVIAGSTDYAFDFYKRFGEKLDTRALFKNSLEQGISLKQAYMEHIEPRLDDQRTKEFDERIKREKEAAVAEFKAKHKFPALAERSQPSVAEVLNMEKKDRPAIGWEAAAEAFVNREK